GPAPVEERSTSRAAGATPSRLPDSGRYTVKRGDSLYSIAFGYGLDWKDVAAWNSIGRPYTIFPGQELRLTSPARSGTTTAVTTRPAGTAPQASTRATTRAATPPTTAADASNTPRATTRTVPDSPPPAQTPSTSTPQVNTTPPPPASAALSDPSSWAWPTEGRVLRSFRAGDPSRKGIDISGDEGQDIRASAAGDVVYSGNGLIGFGELIIIKHSDSMLTAYAHNRSRLVQEGERVAAGAKIAEMGRNDQNQTMLHFELRINGRPVDPLEYLPPR
ncbi:MAG: peptidoglycan DD-metalloendopeptidase family protein, partial [Xanthomonadales bacterium]|nr:peptidoglycan DD-metalloendopeptidase family protein [Xanthomonadales bacterium]